MVTFSIYIALTINFHFFCNSKKLWLSKHIPLANKSCQERLIIISCLQMGADVPDSKRLSLKKTLIFMKCFFWYFSFKRKINLYTMLHIMIRLLGILSLYNFPEIWKGTMSVLMTLVSTWSISIISLHQGWTREWIVPLEYRF